MEFYSWDYLLIYDGDQNLLANLCGNRNPSFGYNDVFLSPSNSLLIYFYSDSDVTSNGIQASYQIIRKNYIFFFFPILFF